jgi:hypothetical protein
MTDRASDAFHFGRAQFHMQSGNSPRAFRHMRKCTRFGGVGGEPDHSDDPTHPDNWDERSKERGYSVSYRTDAEVAAEAAKAAKAAKETHEFYKIIQSQEQNSEAAIENR